MVNTPKKPSNQKGKSVYFNIDDPGELRLYQYAMSIKNFSGYMKAMLYSDMLKNNGHAPSPYNYASIMHPEVFSHETPYSAEPYKKHLPDEVAASTETVGPSPEPVKGKAVYTPEPEEVEDLPDEVEESDLTAEDDVNNPEEDGPEDLPEEGPKKKDISSFLL